MAFSQYHRSPEQSILVFERAADAFARKKVKKVVLLISNYDDESNGYPEENILLISNYDDESNGYPEENIFIHHYIKKKRRNSRGKYQLSVNKK